VPETHATTPPAAPLFPPGRYGRRREPRRRRRAGVALALAAVLLAGFAVAVILYQRYGDPAYRAEVVGYTDITDSQVVLRFRVHLPPGAGAVCAVRARARDGSVVGRAEVPVPAETPEVTYRLATSARPFVGEVVRCRPAD
jgi:hypothetical protein